MSQPPDLPPPDLSQTPAGPAIGKDEWVARHGERRSRRAGLIGEVEERLRRAPWWAWLVLFVAAFALLPVVSGDGYIRRVAFDTVLYMLLALGLNVVVGWGGLLDLGYVAFYGIGAYTYALLSSHQLGVHLPTLVSIPIVVVIGAVAGFLVGLPSRRLIGDYLAIVTLFFLQIFLTVATNGDQIAGHNLTGGANGILNVDPLHLLGHSLEVQHAGRLRRRLPLRRDRVLRRRLRRAALRQPLAHRPRLALAARGSARGRGDGHARQPPQADGLQLRRGRRRAHGHALRVAQRERVPAHVLVPAPDHRLHDGDPRRPGEPRRRHDRRRPGQRPARAAARRGRRPHPLLPRRPARAGLRVRPLAQARRDARGDRRLRLRGARRGRPHTSQLDNGPGGRGPRQRALALGDHPDEPSTGSARSRTSR